MVEPVNQKVLDEIFSGTEAQRLLVQVSEEFVPAMAQVNVGRRATIRAAQLIAGKRAVNAPDNAVVTRSSAAWGKCVDTVRDFTRLFTPELIRIADQLVAKVDDPTEPYGEILSIVAVSGMGFSQAEYEWGLDQLRRAGFDMLTLLSGGDPNTLTALWDGALTAENGLLQLGFVALTSEADANSRIFSVFERMAVARITPSVFHILPALVLFAADRCVDEKTAVARIARRVRDSRDVFTRASREIAH